MFSCPQFFDKGVFTNLLAVSAKFMWETSFLTNAVLLIMSRNELSICIQLLKRF